MLRHRARLAIVDEGQQHSRRVAAEFRARQGSRDAIAQLREPEYPDAVEYLEHILYRVHGHSGATMHGLAPCSWGTLSEYERASGTPLAFEEKLAIMRLDAVLLSPDTETEKPALDVKREAKPVPAWPTQKVQVG